MKPRTTEKNENEDSQNEVGDSESISEDGKNHSETEQHYILCKKRLPNYSHSKTVGYLNAHVKNKSSINVLSTIAKFHKPDIYTTIVTHYLLSQY